MALPKIASPTYDLTVPSSKDTLKYRPFLVKEEKLLLLANESGEDTEIMGAVKQIITNCVFEKLEVDDLALFDLEYIFLRIRAKSVGEVVNLKLLCPDDEETYVDVSVNLDEVAVQFNEEHESTIQLDDSISLIMRYPQFSFAQESTEGSETEYIFKMIKSCIGTIVDGDTIYERADFSDKELDTFIESLTSEHFQRLQKFFETMPRLQHEVKFKNPNTKKQQKVTLEGMNAFFE
jgi:hypothetical protein